MARPTHPFERPKRFYAKVETSAAEGGFAVKLDGRTPRSPLRHALILPTAALAEVIAGEWAAQGDEIDLGSMPATRLTWTVLDHIPAARVAVAAEVARFAGSDLLCYFADGPARLVQRQEERWGPVIAWAETALGLTFQRTQGIVHRPQSAATIERCEVLAAAEDDFVLAALAFAAGLFGSAILAFALRRGELSAQAVFDLSRLDELFQEETWGVDAEAEARAEAMAREAVMLEEWFQALQ